MHSISRFLLLTTVLALAAPGFAQPVSLDLSQTSTVFANAAGGIGPAADPTNTVSSLPYTTPVSASAETEISITTPTLTSSGFSYTADQSADDTGGSASGGIQIFFIAGAGVQYTLTGSGATDSTNENNLSAQLYDRTTSTIVYSEGVGGNPTFSLDSSGGPLTGPLTSGDAYEFTSTAYIEGPIAYAQPTLAPSTPAVYDFTAAASLTFTQAPEPTAAILLLVGLAITGSRRRSHA